jgi:hypothetical protein
MNVNLRSSAVTSERVPLGDVYAEECVTLPHALIS